MSFAVTFYTNTKQHNSTALPSGGSSYNCTAKEPLSIQSPTIILRLADGAAGNPVAWNYAYIAAFHRYYWITDWVNEGPNWAASMQVDVLASFRTDIMSYAPYVLRATQDYDPDIPDTIYPPTCEKLSHTVDMSPSPWVGVPEPEDESTIYGFYTVGIATQGMVEYYGFIPAALDLLLTYLVSDLYAQDALGTWQIAMYPEAKVALNPLQYITSIKYIPIPTPYSQGTTVTSLKIGPVTVGSSYVLCKKLPTTLGRSLLITARNLENYRHPQAARGNWLNQAPWTTYELFFPPFGLIPLDSTIMGQSTKIDATIVMDCRTGDAVLRVYASLQKVGGGTAREDVEIAQVSANVGIDVPISGMLTRQPGGLSTIAQALSGVAGTAAAAASGNTVAAAATLLNTGAGLIGDAVDAAIPHLTVIGSAGSAASLTGIPCLYIVHTGIAEELNRDYGRPLCKTKLLSDLTPGYVLCGNADLSISGTKAEQDQLNVLLNGGVMLG